MPGALFAPVARRSCSVGTWANTTLLRFRFRMVATASYASFSFVLHISRLCCFARHLPHRFTRLEVPLTPNKH